MRGFVLSREVKFLTGFMERIVFDRLAIAEYLLFAYPLGVRTLIEGVSRLEPSSLIQIKIKSKALKIRKIHCWNFEHKTISNKSIREEANDLVKIFLDACSNRINSFNNARYVVSLSGGLDSRAVAAGLSRVGAQIVGATFLDFNKKAAADAAIAKKIANTLRIEWKLFKLKKPDLANIDYLISLEDGLNYTGMSFILSFLNEIKATFGPKVIFTGDEGDVLMPDQRPKIRLKHLDGLVDYTIGENAIFSLDKIENLLRIDRNEIKTEIRRHIEEYPEVDLHQKYIRFILSERCFKLQFEGEDRNRFYFWPVAPFYSIFFFNYVMNIPDRHKKFYRLQKRFLKTLSPECSLINNANWNAPITSSWVYLNEFAKYILSNLPRTVKESIRRTYVVGKRRCKVKQRLSNHILKYLDTSSMVSQYLSDSEARNLIIRGDCNELQFHCLLTIVGYICKLEKQLTNRSMALADKL